MEATGYRRLTADVGLKINWHLSRVSQMCYSEDMKTAVLHTRIAPTLKTQAETVFDKIGLSSSDAIRIFFKQVILRKGLPFDVAIPNKETAATLKNSERNIGIRTFEAPEDAFAEWENL